MGWFGGYHRRQEMIDELIKASDYTKETGQNVHIHTLRHCYRGNAYSGVLWVVRHVDVQGEEPYAYIACHLMNFRTEDKAQGGWAYKPLEESSGPYSYSCPLGYLDMAREYNPEWREKVRRHHRLRRMPPGLLVGDVLRAFDGWEPQETVVTQCRPLEARAGARWYKVPAKAIKEVERDGVVVMQRDEDMSWVEEA